MTNPTRKIPEVLEPTTIRASTKVQYSGAKPARIPNTT